MYYDPRGQVIRTVNPDGSEQRVIYGVPEDLNNPDQFTPTPWEIYTYDANDNAGRTHPTASEGYKHHWNTPASVVVDALGRTVEAVERNRNKSRPDIEKYRTRSSYDIRGNLLTVTDALGREAFKYVYDLANNPLRIQNIDAGIRRNVLDAAGNEVERRDRKGALILQTYDVLNRPSQLWAQDGTGQSLTLREYIMYGDHPDLDAAQAKTTNRRGKLYRHYDEAGMLTFETYDFKGNVLEKVRQVISDERILAVFPSSNDPSPDWHINAFRVDWQPPNGMSLEALENYARDLLDTTEYRTSMTYDALNRVKTMDYPEDVNGERKQLHQEYNRAGALEQVKIEHVESEGTTQMETYVQHIAYNARGQRTLIVYGNGVMTRYAYDPQTFRLVRMRTERYTSIDPFRYRPKPLTNEEALKKNLLQDFTYNYDLVGNIVKIEDRTPKSGIPGTPLGADALDRTFSYDPLYRLLSATGRECDLPSERPPWDDQPRCADITRARSYTEQYQYDPVGNMSQLRHQTNGTGFTRQFELLPETNRLKHVTIGTTVLNYRYDANGNMSNETTSRHFEWDHSDQMRVYRTQAESAEPSVYAQYLYDAAGQRVKKLIRKQGGQFEITVYIDGVFEYHRLVQPGGMKENNTLHVMDDQQRIALIRVGDAFPHDGALDIPVKYHLGDHLGSSSLVIDGDGNWMNREECTPYGETSFGSFAKKRYRFTGKERDEENGLYYHGARYYAPWLVRWISCDPAGMVDGTSLYLYVRNNPSSLIDSTGMQAENIRQEDLQTNLHIIIVGTDAPSDNQHAHGAGQKNFTRRVNTLINQRTVIEDFPSRVDPGERILVIVPSSTKSQRIKELFSYGKRYGRQFEVWKVASNELPRTLRSQKNIESFYFFGHGRKEGPIFEYGQSRIPAPSAFDPTQFTPDAMAVFATCNSWEYAREFMKKTHVESIGVRGTTFYGVEKETGREEISAGRLLPELSSGTSVAWRYRYEKGGPWFLSEKWSISQRRGTPFLRIEKRLHLEAKDLLPLEID